MPGGESSLLPTCPGGLGEVRILVPLADGGGSLSDLGQLLSLQGSLNVGSQFPSSAALVPWGPGRSQGGEGQASGSPQKELDQQGPLLPWLCPCVSLITSCVCDDGSGGLCPLASGS